MLYKHVKRETIYEVVSRNTHFLNTFSSEGSIHTITLLTGETVEAEFQCSECEKECSKYAGLIVVYRGTDNKYWMRPDFEFFDGRFEEI